VTVGPAELRALGLRDFLADFHCVTTWSVTGVTWTGVPLAEVLRSNGLTSAPSPYVVAYAQDRRRATFVWEDALAPDVLLATELEGQPLGPRHGGPLRLVAPRHYGYKSIKHLVRIDLRSVPPRSLGKEHLRGRVALEERHPRYPSRVVKIPYRLLIPPTAAIAERTLARKTSTTR
jgi:DMSO/TMAO reductase YedYZ molybdopterin-dependent catalytic subunit